MTTKQALLLWSLMGGGGLCELQRRAARSARRARGCVEATGAAWQVRGGVAMLSFSVCYASDLVQLAWGRVSSLSRAQCRARERCTRPPRLTSREGIVKLRHLDFSL